MAFFDTCFYCNAGDQATTGYYAVALRPQNAAVAAGQLVRQFTAPAVNSERVFVCIVAGTTANVTDATWVLTRGAKTTDNTVTWQECTGVAALNGDQTNTVTWAAMKAIGGSISLGVVIKRNNGASYWICSIAGSSGASEPAWPNDTAGSTRTDGTATWTCLGVVGNFTGGQAPHARLIAAAAANWLAAGGTIYVGDNHAESASSCSLQLPNAGAGVINRIICHNHSGSYPPTSATTGATVSSTGTGAGAMLIFFGGSGPGYIYGVTFISGVGQSASADLDLGSSVSGPNWYLFDNCSFQLASTGGGSLTFGYHTGGISCVLILNNCTVKVASTSGAFAMYAPTIIWQGGGLAAGSASPGSMFLGNAFTGSIVFEGLDLSLWTGSLLTIGANTPFGSLLIKDCKLNTALSVPGAAIPNSGLVVQAVRSDSGATAYKSARYVYEGAETTETLVTRVGGASDPTGQQQSRMIVTGANSNWLRPFKAEPYAIWNPRTAVNVVVTVYGIAGSLPNNDDIWLDVEYLGNASFPIGSIVNTTKANVLAANAAVASDSSTWNTALYEQFDPATLSGATLSSGNLTAVYSSGSSAGVYGFAPQSTGKYYFEITAGPNHGSNGCLGLYPTTGSSFGQVAGGTGGNATMVTWTGGTLFTNGGTTAQNIGTIVSGDVIGVAVDLGARLAWIRRNAGIWNNSGTANPATGVGGMTVFPTVPFAPLIFFGSLGTAGTDTATGNFGATAYANAAPAGFGNWPGLTPFKLVATLSAPQPQMSSYVHIRPRVAKPSTTIYLDPMVVLS